MIMIGLEDADLGACVQDAQQERVVITREGKPVALIIGVEGLDVEQLELGSNPRFWTLIEARRKQPTRSRTELEQLVAAPEQ
jgi:antitoxin (DNA-binding transcriptional repressor) of toxin-antitoxin stability system